MRAEEFLLIRLTVPAGHRPSAPPISILLFWKHVVTQRRSHVVVVVVVVVVVIV